MKRGTTEHPKLLDLCSILSLRKFEAVGILETLWHFTAKFAPQGDVGKYPDKAICKALDWRRDPQALIDGLVASGWVDRDSKCRLLIHDWEDHSDQTLRRFLASRELAFIQHSASEEKPAQPPLPADAKPPLPLPLPDPIPLPKRAADAAKEAMRPIATQIHERHPEPRRDIGVDAILSKLAAIMRYKKLPKPGWLEFAESINETHRMKCATHEWSKDGGEYSKGLANWLAPTLCRYEQSCLPSLLSSEPQGMIL